MAMKKGYKQTEVGVIPEDWEASVIGFLCAAVLDCHHSTPVWTSSGSIVIRNQNIRDGKLDLSKPSFTDENHFAERTRRALPSFGDLVITREAPMGLVCMIPKGLRCCLGQRMVLLRPNHDIVDTKYLLYALQGGACQRAIAVAGGTGSTVSNLRIPVLKGLSIPTPPLQEQRAIATALSDADAWIESLEQLIAKKRQIKQGAMQELLTGKRRLPGFSGEWETTTLGLTCTFENGDRSSNYPTLSSFRRSGIPFINAGHLSNGRISLKQMDYITEQAYNNLGGGKVRAGDILFCLRGSLGKFGVVNESFGEAAIASSLVIIRPNSKKLDCEFLRSYFNSARCTQMIELLSGGAAQPNLGVQDLTRFEIPIPPSLQEQTAIATVLSDMDTEIDSLVLKLAKAREIKQGMMQELLTGRIRLVN